MFAFCEPGHCKSERKTEVLSLRLLLLGATRYD